MSSHIILVIFVFNTLSNIQCQEILVDDVEISSSLPPITVNSIEQCKYIDILSALNCEDVDNLTSITANQAQTSSIKSLYVKPRNLISFDADFSFSYQILDKFQNNFDVNLENFNRFAYPHNPFRNLNAKPNTLVLSDSYLDFFSSSHENTLLNELCVFFPNEIEPLFSSFKRVILDKSVKFNGPSCPLIFKNANLDRLIISSLPEKNNFQFSTLSHIDDLNDQLSTSLNSTIKSFEIFQSSLKFLNRTLIDPFVFFKTERIVYHSLDSDFEIQNDLFIDFLSLKSFELAVPDFSRFFKFKNLTWIHSLNANVSIDLTNPTQLLNQENNFKLVFIDINSNIYSYPDEDFCLFADFPHQKRIFPIFESSNSLNCSCTLIWLTLYYPYYDELPTLTGSKCDYKENFNQSIAQCNFEEKILNCAKTNITTVLSTIPSSLGTNPIITSTVYTQPVEKCEYFSNASLLKCNDINDLSIVKANQPIQTLFIRPKNSLRLDNSLNFSGSETNFKENYQVIFQNFDGFNLNANGMFPPGGNIEIYESNFEFYSSYHGSSSLSELCIFIRLNYRFLFSSFKNLILGSEVLFSKPLCPLIFKDSRLSRLIISAVSETNYFKFVELNKFENETSNLSSLLNSSIQSFEVYKSGLKKLDSDFLNENVFERLENFKYYSLETNFKIQDDLFESFKYLKEFELYVPNLSTFLKNSSLDWISSINYGTQIDLTSESQLIDQENKNKQFRLKLWETSSSYLFPDEDLCYFKDFPHKQLIYLILEDNREISCSCTVVFITQFYPYFNDFKNLVEKSSFKCNYTHGFDLLIKSCNFEQEIAKCKNLTTTTTTTTATTTTTTTAITSTSISASTISVVISSSTITSIDKDDANNIGVIIGSVIGGLAGLTLIIIVSYFAFVKLKKGRKIEPNGENEMKKI